VKYLHPAPGDDAEDHGAILSADHRELLSLTSYDLHVRMGDKGTPTVTLASARSSTCTQVSGMNRFGGRRRTGAGMNPVPDFLGALTLLEDPLRNDPEHGTHFQTPIG